MAEKKKVLVVDDDRLNVMMLTEELDSSGYAILKAFNGEEAIAIAREYRPDVILLDIVMPGMDGYDVCKSLKETEETKHIPVIMLTGLSAREAKHKGLEYGAVDFLNKPVDMTELFIRLKNVIELKEYQDFLKDYNEKLEKTVKERTFELRESFIDTIYRLTLAAEHKDKGTATHLKRVSHSASLLARLIGISEKEAEIIFYASPMHDVGKIGVPDSILQHTGKLTPEEFEVMKKHPTIGGEILAGSDSQYLASARKFALYHHENWDGTGYPHGLRGEDIPVEGRIMLMVDRYDALRSARPYKKAFDHEMSLKLLTGEEKTVLAHLDPMIFEAFRDNHGQFAEIFDEYRDD